MLKFKDVFGNATEMPWIFQFIHQDDKWVHKGIIELEEDDELGIMQVLRNGFELVTEANPNPQFGDTNEEALTARARELVADKRAQKQIEQLPLFTESNGDAAGAVVEEIKATRKRK